jgi:hypothetical protein
MAYHPVPSSMNQTQSTCPSDCNPTMRLFKIGVAEALVKEASETSEKKVAVALDLLILHLC